MADTDLHYTRLNAAEGSFNEMIKAFGVVTVMNVDIYPAEAEEWYSEKTPYEVVNDLFFEGTPICHLDTLKIANITVDGPSKTISGGQYANPLIKFGKTARLEMQDALGHIDAIDLLCGGVAERKDNPWDGAGIGLHVGEDFNEPVIIVGDTFFISKETQQQVPVKIVFYKFLPDSIFNLTQDAEGDAAVFDINGDLLATEVMLGTDDTTTNPPDRENEPHALFYSIIDPNHYIHDPRG